MPTVLGDTGPAGVSVGDTLRYAATATATGELGCANAVLMGHLTDGTTLVVDSAVLSGNVASATVSLPGDLTFSVGALIPGTPITLQWDVTVDQVADCTELTPSATLSCAGR